MAFALVLFLPAKKRDVCNDRVTIVWFVWYNGVSLMLFD